MTATRTGQLWVIAAPSGAGKTSLVRELLARDPSLRFSISYTTRAPRSSETPGKDYFFVSEPKFQEMVRDDAFLEHAQVFDHWYGTGREHVASLQADGHQRRARDRLARRPASPRAGPGLAERVHSSAERR